MVCNSGKSESKNTFIHCIEEHIEFEDISSRTVYFLYMSMVNLEIKLSYDSNPARYF